MPNVNVTVQDRAVKQLLCFDRLSTSECSVTQRALSLSLSLLALLDRMVCDLQARFDPRTCSLPL